MQFKNTALNGVQLVTLDEHSDERGFFARIFCQNEFETQGLDGHVVQANLSYNRHRGTVRGMHYQIAPHPEAKLVRCIQGSILDVVVDLRESSPTFRQHIAVELSSANRHALFIPPMCAHGFQTLEDDTEVMYMVTGFYAPECERGLRHDDPALSIHWPMPASSVSPKDRQWPLIGGLETNDELGGKSDG